MSILQTAAVAFSPASLYVVAVANILVKVYIIYGSAEATSFYGPNSL